MNQIDGRKESKMAMNNMNGYEITKITAIPGCDNERQDALLVVNEQDGEKAEYVVFGYEMPEDEEDFANMCSDPSALESLDDSHDIRIA